MSHIHRTVSAGGYRPPKSRSFRFLVLGKQHKPADCLGECSDFKEAKLANRVGSCTIAQIQDGPGKGETTIAKYTWDTDPQHLVARVLSTSADKRTDCVMILSIPELQPVHFYADLDLGLQDLNVCDTDAMHAALVHYLEACFKKMYPGMPLHSEYFWYFCANTLIKLSSHIHADPHAPVLCGPARWS